MKNLILSAAMLTLLATACKKAEDKAVTVTTPSSDTTLVVKDEAPAKEPDSAAMMAAWEKYKTPGDAHKTLALDAGTWDAEMTMYMSPNDPKPTKAKLNAVSKMTMGGRYQETRYSGTVWGQPFEGVGTMGFNNASNKLESTWIDNSGTGLMYMSGDYDGTSKKMALNGEFSDPMTGKMKAFRETYEIVDDNNRKMEMFDISPDGKEYKSMEITMTRKK